MGEPPEPREGVAITKSQANDRKERVYRDHVDAAECGDRSPCGTALGNGDQDLPTAHSRSVSRLAQADINHPTGRLDVLP